MIQLLQSRQVLDVLDLVETHVESPNVCEIFQTVEFFDQIVVQFQLFKRRGTG